MVSELPAFQIPMIVKGGHLMMDLENGAYF